MGKKNISNWKNWDTYRQYKSKSLFYDDFDVVKADTAYDRVYGQEASMNALKFYEVIKETFAGDTKYITSIETFKHSREGISDQKLLVRTKDYLTDDWIYEVFATRLSNLFGEETVFNTHLIKSAEVDVLITLDCAKENEQLISMEELADVDSLNCIRLDYWMRLLDKVFASDKLNFEVSEEDKSLIKDRLVKQYLFRKFVMMDGYYNLDTIHFLVDEENKSLKLGPNRFMEYIFNSPIMLGDLEAAYAYCQENCPQIWDEFMTKFKDLSEQKLYKKVTKSSEFNALQRLRLNMYSSDNFKFNVNKLEEFTRSKENSREI